MAIRFTVPADFDVARIYNVWTEAEDFVTEYSCLDEDEATEWYMQEFGEDFRNKLGRDMRKDEVRVKFVGYTIYDGDSIYDIDIAEKYIYAY